MAGRHNVENAVGVYAAGRSLGLTSEQIAEGFASFRGVKRRQEPRGEPNGVLVIDDFAHHPTAVRETIHAIRLRYPERSEEHTSELQSRRELVCRLLLEKKKHASISV